VPSQRNKLYVDYVEALPNFDYSRELDQLLSKFPDQIDLLLASIDQKLVTKDDACRLWGDAIGVAYVDPFASVVTEEAIEKIPAEIAKKVKSIGLYMLAGTLTVAMATPDDAELVRRLSQIAQVPISPVFALPREIEDAISIHYSTEKTIEESLAGLERASVFDAAGDNSEKLAALADSDSVIGFVDEIIYYALRERATDIHIEPQETLARVRFRIDGNLREMLTYSRKLHRAIISRLKIISNLNISETRFPQDGRFSLPIGCEHDARHPRLHDPHDLRRIHLPAPPQHQEGGLFDGETGHEPGGTGRHLREAGGSPWHHPSDRPHRLGQEHLAERLPETDQLERPAHRHDRGPDRIRGRRREPDAGAPRDRTLLRQRPAPCAAPGSRRDHGGRNPRP